MGSVSERIPWFNNQSIAQFLKYAYGVVFTDPSKDSFVTPYLTDKPSFLCREFLEVDGFLRAPLDENSLLRLLYYVRKTDAMCEMDSFLINLSVCERELVHYPTERRERIMEMILLACQKAGISYMPNSYNYWFKCWMNSYSEGFYIE